MLSEKGKFMRKSTSSNKQEHTETSTEEQLAVIASILRIWWPQRYRHMLSQKGLSPAQMCSAALEVLQPITSWDIQSATDFCKLWVASWLNLDECIILEAAWNCYQNVCPYLSSSEYASRGQHIHQTNNMHRQPWRFMKIQARTSSLKIFLNSAAFSPIWPCVSTPVFTDFVRHILWNTPDGKQNKGSRLLHVQMNSMWQFTFLWHLFYHVCSSYSKSLETFTAAAHVQVSAYQVWADTFSSGTDPSVPVCQGID